MSLMSPGDLWWRTTAKWEEFILHAEVAWHTHLEEERWVWGLWGVEILEGLDKDDTSTTSKSQIHLPNEPSKFKFFTPPTVGDDKFKFVKKEDEGEEADVSKGESVGAVEEVRRAVMALDPKLRELVDTLQMDQVGIMGHLWNSITRLRSSVDSLRARVRGVEQEVGDMAEVLDEYNLVNLSEGVMRAMGQIAPSTFMPADFDELQAKVGKLLDLIRAVDEDHQQASKLLTRKFHSIPVQSSPSGGGPGILGGALLSMGMDIINNAGEVIGTLGQLLQGIKTLTSENALLHWTAWPSRWNLKHWRR
jgi:hypothetical protein